MAAIANGPLFKGAALVALAIIAFRQPSTRGKSDIDRHLISSAIAITVSMSIARILQSTLADRTRPTAMLGEPNSLSGFSETSSFPSDHAVMMSAIALTIYLWHSRLGLIAMAWSLIVILLPRIYLGYHYPSDIVAGIGIGTMITLGIFALPLPAFALIRLRHWKTTYSTLVIAGAFLLAFSIGNNFESLRFATSSLFGLIGF